MEMSLKFNGESRAGDSIWTVFQVMGLGIIEVEKRRGQRIKPWSTSTSITWEEDEESVKELRRKSQ